MAPSAAKPGAMHGIAGLGLEQKPGQARASNQGKRKDRKDSARTTQGQRKDSARTAQGQRKDNARTTQGQRKDSKDKARTQHRECKVKFPHALPSDPFLPCPDPSPSVPPELRSSLRALSFALTRSPSSVGLLFKYLPTIIHLSTGSVSFFTQAGNTTKESLQNSLLDAGAWPLAAGRRHLELSLGCWSTWMLFWLLPWGE